MTQLSRHPAYLLIEDQLDAIGQKYRVVQLARGAMLWGVCGLLVSMAAALAAHGLGAGWGARLVLVMWMGWMGASLWVWVARPLLFRPRAVQMARLIEGRIEGLHNCLTNSVLLARASDVQDSPFLGAIYDENLRTMRGRSIDEAVRVQDLGPLAWRLGGALVVAVMLLLIWPGVFGHGWRQMLAPNRFVPVVGRMNIERVLPGDTTLVMGQPLEISVVASGPQEPEAKLWFDNGGEAAVLAPTVREDGKLGYAYRADFVEQSLRYRVEVGDSQSPWYSVNVVPDVKLTELTLHVTPPAYTGIEAQVLRMKGEEAGQAPIALAEGSRVEVTAAIDVAMAGAMIQLGQASPAAMQVGAGGQAFSAGFDLLETTTLSILLTSDTGQITAQVPEQALVIQSTPDAPPGIEMEWPTQDVAVAPDAVLRVAAALKDDHGLVQGRVLMSAVGSGSEEGAGGLAVVHEANLTGRSGRVEHELALPAELRAHGRAVRVQVEAVDNRLITAMGSTGGAQTTRSAVYEVRFSDPQQIARERQDKADRLRALLMEMLKRQQTLHTAAVAFVAAEPGETMAKVHAGQVELRQTMLSTAETFDFDADNRVVQKTLLVLVHNPAREAVELAAAIQSELVAQQREAMNAQLQGQQRRIISTLESLLAMLDVLPQATAAETPRRGGDLDAKAEFEKLNEALKEFIEEQQRVLDQTAALAKKPVDDWDDADRKLLDELLQSQEKLDAFMQQKVNDFSKLAEQDMANASLLKELMEVYSEVTMAKDALKKDAVEIAVALEETGAELAQEIQSNLEKWLMEEPDRIKWAMEDPVGPMEVPMAELPDELEDMIGELMEQQEDLFEDIEDTNANWADSLDKGAGWDAMDGPIANMSAKGVTGNTLPNNNEMGGRSGEGRSGKSQGEMVEETASGKGGRNTPTRLDPTAFQQGQITDTSTDPVGGATGGGKLSGQGGEGLEGPVPNRRDIETQRLQQRQAAIRNAAERLNLQLRLGQYDNFKLLESIALMRRVESDLAANRYQTALRRRDVLLDKMDTSHLLLSGRIHVERDTSPTMSRKLEEQIHDSMQGNLPPAWEGALKQYYEKLGRE